MAGREIPDEAAREFERLGSEQRRHAAARVVAYDTDWAVKP